MGGGAGSAGSDLSQVLVQVTLAHAMTLDLGFHGAIIVGGGIPTGTTDIMGATELDLSPSVATTDGIDQAVITAAA